MIVIKKPSLFPLPAAPINKAAYALWKRTVLDEVRVAVNKYYFTMPTYEPPAVHTNPRA